MNNKQEYIEEIKFQVELRTSLIVPVVDYLSTISYMFKHKEKQYHKMIVREFMPYLSWSVKSNGEDNVFKYVDLQNDFIDELNNIKDHKQFNTDLRKCIKRGNIHYIGEVELNLSNEYKVNNTELGRYYDCLLYILTQYQELKEIQEANSLLKITAYNPAIYNILLKQCESISKKINYLGNPYTVNSMMYYIIAKSHLKDNSTVFDNEVKMIIKKNS